MARYNAWGKLVLITLVALACGLGLADASNYAGGSVFYWSDGHPNALTKQEMVARYSVGVCGFDVNNAVGDISAVDPSFMWFTYRHAGANYTSGSSLTKLYHVCTARAADSLGISLDKAYLHFWDDTQYTVAGHTLNIPGWGGGSAAAESLARIPCEVYPATFMLGNYSTAQGLKLNVLGTLRGSVDAVYPGTTIHPAGLWMDTVAYWCSSAGTVVSGGHVAETPSHSLVLAEDWGSPFAAWWWTYNEKPFLRALHDTLLTSASWSKGRTRKYMAINTSAAWQSGNDYATAGITDYIFTEFAYGPVEHFEPYFKTASYRDSITALSGVKTWNAPYPQRTYGGNSITYAQALLGCYAEHLCLRRNGDLFQVAGTWDPATAGWDTLNYRGVIDTCRVHLGDLMGTAPYVIQSGMDPLGRPYRIWARAYANGMSLVRPRYTWNDPLNPASAVSVILPEVLHELNVDGRPSAGTNTVSMETGTGAILLRDITTGIPPGGSVPAADFSATPRSGSAPLRVEFRDRSANVPTSWYWNLGDCAFTTSQNPTHSYTAPGIYTVTLTATNALGSDTESKVGYITVLSDPPGDGGTVITNLEKVLLTAQAVDAAGNPAPVDGIPTWVLSDQSFLTLNVAQDGMTAYAMSSGKIGASTITVSGDALLGAIRLAGWPWRRALRAREVARVSIRRADSESPELACRDAQYAGFRTRANPNPGKWRPAPDPRKR